MSAAWYHFACGACGNAVSTEDPEHPESPFPCLKCGQRAGWRTMTKEAYDAAKRAEENGKEGVFDTYGEHPSVLGK